MPGKGPDGKATWPPAPGCMRVTAGETSSGPGSAHAGRKGSFFALMTRVGTAMDLSRDLLDTLSQ